MHLTADGQTSFELNFHAGAAHWYCSSLSHLLIEVVWQIVVWLHGALLVELLTEPLMYRDLGALIESVHFISMRFGAMIILEAR